MNPRATCAGVAQTQHHLLYSRVPADTLLADTSIRTAAFIACYVQSPRTASPWSSNQDNQGTQGTLDTTWNGERLPHADADADDGCNR